MRVTETKKLTFTFEIEEELMECFYIDHYRDRQNSLPKADKFVQDNFGSGWFINNDSIKQNGLFTVKCKIEKTIYG